jgi:hypothetical protein
MVRLYSDGCVYEIPLVLNAGLPYVKMTPPTIEQLNDETTPHVLLTSDMPWDPTKYDEPDEEVPQTPLIPFEHEAEPSRADTVSAFFSKMSRVCNYEVGSDADSITNDEFCELHDSDLPESIQAERNSHFSLCETMPNIVASFASACCTGYKTNKTYLEHKYGKTLKEFQPNLGFLPTERIKATIEASTQFFRAHQWSKKIKRHYKSRFPGANVKRVNETVSTDTAYMDVKGAADGITGYGGAMGFQLFVGNDSKHLAVYTLKTNGEYPRCLGKYIRTHGAAKKMFCDNAKAQTSEEVKQLYRNFGIDDGNSEPHYQNQNHAEREIQDVKKALIHLMNVTNTPTNMWPLCVEYICLLKNHTARSSLKDRMPIEKRTGSTPDISKFLTYRWWEPVYYLNEEGTECLGCWAGVAEHVGDELTYVVVSNKTGHAMYRSDLRTATDPNAPNFCSEVVAGDKLFKKPSSDSKGTGSHQPLFLSFCDDEEEKHYPFAPEELLGKVFHQEDANGNIARVEIVRLLKQDALDTEKRVQFLVESHQAGETAESVMEYNEVCDIAEAQLHAIKHGNLSQGTRVFKSILAHDGPLSVKDPKYKGSMYNILIEWDDAEPTWEPLNIIAKDDPVSCAMYAEANKLLDTKGWRWLKRHAKNLRKIYKRVYEALKAKHGAKYKYGVWLPDRQKNF